MSRKYSAQSIVEFALIIPIILLFVMGVLDFGRAFFMKVALINAAREGAYYLSTNPSDVSNCDLVDPTFCYLNTRQAVVDEAYAAGMNVQPVDVTISNCCTIGQPIEVVVTSSIDLSIYEFLFGPLSLEGKARMMMQR